MLSFIAGVLVGMVGLCAFVSGLGIYAYRNPRFSGKVLGTVMARQMAMRNGNGKSDRKL